MNNLPECIPTCRDIPTWRTRNIFNEPATGMGFNWEEEENKKQEFVPHRAALIFDVVVLDDDAMCGWCD